MVQLRASWIVLSFPDLVIFVAEPSSSSFDEDVVCRRFLELGHCESRTWLCTKRHGQLIQVTSEIRVDLPWRVEQLSLIMGSRLPYLSSFPQISLWSHCRSLESFSSTSVLSFREPYLPGSYSIAYTWSKRVTQTLILWSGFHVLRISIGSP